MSFVNASNNLLNKHKITINNNDQKHNNNNNDTNANGNDNDNNVNVPSWLENITLHRAINATVGVYDQIISFNLKNEVKNYDNGFYLRLKIDIEVLLKNGATKITSILLKTQPNNEMLATIVKRLHLLQREEHLYKIILPKFEELYRNVNKMTKFAPIAYTFDRDIGADYVLLEDLRLRNFKYVQNPTAGLDMTHMQNALIKLAEFHAASACYVEHFGQFAEQFTVGIYSAANRELLQEFNASVAFLAQLKKWRNCEEYYKKLVNFDYYLIDRLLNEQQINAAEFNVLNHGDLCVNNIMFQYNDKGQIIDTRFVDFQVSKYGSPAYDLYYLILSSAALDIKLTQFEYFVRFYYEHLIKNLKLLHYHRPLPKLHKLHTALIKNGLTAYLVISKVLPIIMSENKTNNYGAENLKRTENKFKLELYTNNKYVQAVTLILPWLDNRGLLDLQ